MHGEDLGRELRAKLLFGFRHSHPYSDDTQLTGGVYPEHLASHFAKRFVAGRITGIGASTLKAMRDLVAGVHWGLAGCRGQYAAGNGAAMRIAPLAFLFDPHNPAERTVIRDVCRITHHNDEAYIGALAVVIAIRSILAGDWAPDKTLLATVAESIPDSAVRDRGTFKSEAAAKVEIVREELDDAI